MLRIRYSNKFKKNYKTIVKRGYNQKLLMVVIRMLAEEKLLPQEYHDHVLSGNFSGHRECHITSDWLLIYKIKRNVITLVLTRTGTHSDLF